MKSLFAAIKKWLHRLFWQPPPNIRPEQAKERANALGEVNTIANHR
jgi:hypothetical protein